MENDSFNIEHPSQDTPKPKASTLSMATIRINAPLEPKKAKWKPGGSTPPPPEDIKSFPDWGLREDLRRVKNDVAEAYQCDPSIVLAAIFSASGTALGKSIIGHFGVYENYPANWFTIVGDAGVASKSPAVEWVYKPLMDYDAEAYKEYQASRVQYLAEAKEGRGDPPRLRSKMASNITDEMLLRKLAYNDGALCWKHDELATLLGGLGKYSNGGSSMIVGNLLSIFSGVNFTKESVNSEPLFIPSPALNIITTTQNDTLKKLMAPYLQNGFFERFLYVNIYGTIPPYKESIISEDTKRIWRESIDELIRNDVADIHEHQAAYNAHVNAINRWRDEARIMAECNSSDPFEKVCCSLLVKANYHLCRLSIIVARLNGNEIITAPDMEYSIACMDYLIKEQKVALLKVLHDDQQREPTKEETIRQLYRHYPGLNKSALAGALGISQPRISKVINSG